MWRWTTTNPIKEDPLYTFILRVREQVSLNEMNEIYQNYSSSKLAKVKIETLSISFFLLQNCLELLSERWSPGPVGISRLWSSDSNCLCYRSCWKRSPSYSSNKTGRPQNFPESSDPSLSLWYGKNEKSPFLLLTKLSVGVCGHILDGLLCSSFLPKVRHVEDLLSLLPPPSGSHWNGADRQEEISYEIKTFRSVQCSVPLLFL